MGALENTKTVIYPNLRAEISRHGDTLEDLAAALNMSVSAVSRRLSGSIEWGIGEIDILCKRYNVAFEYLFKRE